MSVAEIGQLHARYVRLSDKFKAAWTYNQYASGIYKNFIQAPLPYRIDFQKLYESIRTAGDAIHTVGSSQGSSMLEGCERAIEPLLKQLRSADAAIGPSLLRRFFERLRSQDDKIIFHLLKFYLYSGEIEEDVRDKLDFLFTRIAEDLVEERGYLLKDGAELRSQLHGLTSIRGSVGVQGDEVSKVVRTIRALRDEIQAAEAIEDLTNRRLLQNFRELKHRMGELFLEPEVLLAIIDCNIATKNTFTRLYKEQELQIIEDSRKLLDSPEAAELARSNPALAGDLQKFREIKQTFDDSRARSDVKHQVITELKSTMDKLLAQLDLDFASPFEGSSEALAIAEEVDELEEIFGRDRLLFPYLQKIHSILNYVDPEQSEERIARSPEAKGLRLETWEVSAFHKLFLGQPLHAGESEEMLRNYLRAAALRLKIDDEVTRILESRPDPPRTLIENAAWSVEMARQLDEQFGAFLAGMPFELHQKVVHQLYRSRVRLVRAYTGLWLVQDQHMTPEERLASFS